MAKSILITGGTGSFGKAFLKKILESKLYERIVIYSRDELKQWELQQTFSIQKYPSLRYFLGDIRDKSRLREALENIDVVVHAAALKQVPAAEYNPMEFIKTNVLGANNLIEACLATSVKKVIALSTDKAAAPINLYGATKLCSDKLFVAANNIKGNKEILFSVVRYGNVMGSRGSVIPYFLNMKKSGKLPITDIKMTRFNITLADGVKMVEWAMNNALGGEIFVPKIPSYRVIDVADAIDETCEKDIIGIRPGEKLHEEMITESDAPNTIDIGKYYAILPSDKTYEQKYIDAGITFKKFSLENGSYNSGTNSEFLSVESLKELIKNECKNIDI
ncbi:UDP-N-acetylglucosamine 4,6-dehydratase (inverting) [Synechococcus sp. UW69]|uniref:UDP-N-acetylglucosamine 4,6-dehydratase (inverting) n=1 Tax=Synechococcus sp. UW69 TaxID=368493 RepID=UPI000E0E509B|nr:UDP-N-acetylglucosamine 4,6-dehydratase (inverting) [Synechococcus sp. UW69]